MKIFLMRLLYLIPIPLIVIFVNYFEDPANLFNEKYELGIAEYLANGYNVTNVVNYNERRLQKFFIEKMKDCPTVVALGSSRIMEINSKNIGEANFINNSVSGATFEDYLAIYYLYKKKGCKIHKIIIGLDPWQLNDHNDQSRWKTLGEEYSVFMKSIFNNVVVDQPKFRLYEIGTYRELMSFSYFKTSLKYLLKGEYGKYLPTKKIINRGFTRLKDGSISYDSLYLNATKSDLAQIVEDYKDYSLGNFSELSEKYKLIFSGFVEYLQKQNIEIEFFLSPYHPILYEYFKKHSSYNMVFAAEKYFNDFAHNRKIKVHGSYDPAKYNLTDSCFLDGIHCNQNSIDKIIKENNL